jgi:integrase
MVVAMVLPQKTRTKTPRTKRQTGADGTMTIAGKLPNGSGSVYFAPSAGVWRATYNFPDDHKRRVVQGRTREQAEGRRDRALAAYRPGAGTPSAFTDRSTVKEMTTWWLANTAQLRYGGRPTTLGAYAVHLGATRIAPIANISVRELRTEQVEAWLVGLSETLASTTVRGSRTGLKQVLDAAVRNGLVASNPVIGAALPTAPKKKRRVLEPVDVHRLIESCDTSRYAAAVAILYTTGLRISEVLGLSWHDIDLDRGVVVVRRAVVEAKGLGRHLGPTKNTGAMGEHRLAPGAVERLRRRRVEQAEERSRAGAMFPLHIFEGANVDLVFTTPDGGFGSRQEVDKLVRRRAVGLGISAEGLGTHTGRRSVVTALYKSGVDIDDIAAHVGHASSTTTSGYVGDRGHERPRRTAEQAFDLLDPPSRI